MLHSTILFIFCLVLIIPVVLAQIPPALGYSQAQGNDGVLQLRVIYESDAIAAGNGVVKIVLPDGTVGCADLVDTTNVNASEIRVSTQYGTRAWRKVESFCTIVGGTDNDHGYSVVQTSDDGFAVAGRTSSFGAGQTDLFLLKFDFVGSLEWAFAVGGWNDDQGLSVVQTNDDGFAVAGGTSSLGAGSGDLLLVKFSSAGDLEWTRAVGGAGDEIGFSVLQTSDYGYIVLGRTNSFGAGSDDLFLVKFSSAGDLEWSMAVGGGECGGHSIAPTSDGGFAVAGRTSSYGAGSSDLFLVKFSSVGDV
ncbi:MAG: hypothetical protein ACP5ER_06815, partial [Candidatus Bathyarchaeales archaeon]